MFYSFGVCTMDEPVKLASDRLIQDGIIINRIEGDDSIIFQQNNHMIFCCRCDMPFVGAACPICGFENYNYV